MKRANQLIFSSFHSPCGRPAGGRWTLAAPLGAAACRVRRDQRTEGVVVIAVLAAATAATAAAAGAVVAAAPERPRRAISLSPPPQLL